MPKRDNKALRARRSLQEKEDDSSSSISSGSSSCSDLGPTICFICSKLFEDDGTFRKHMRRRHLQGSVSRLKIHDTIAEGMKPIATFTTLNRRRVRHKNTKLSTTHPNLKDDGKVTSRKGEPGILLSKLHEALRSKATGSLDSPPTQVGAQCPQPKINPLPQLINPSMTSAKSEIWRDDFPLFKMVRIAFEIDEHGLFPDDAIFMDNPKFSPRSGNWLLDLSATCDNSQILVRTIDGHEGHLPSRTLLKRLESPWGLQESLPLNPRGVAMEMAAPKRNLTKRQGGGAAFSKNEVVLVLKSDGAHAVVVDYDGRVGRVKQWDLSIRSIKAGPPWGLLVDTESWRVITEI